MDYVHLGKSGFKLSALGLGTWMLGAQREREIEALRTGFDNGINLVDTAEMYGTEHIVAQALKDREDIFVATKVSPTHFHYDELIASCEASLRTLGVKSIDLYQLHWPNRNVPIEETMRAMEKLVEQGKIRYIGVSNFSVDELEKAQHALKRNEIVSNQVEYSLLVRDVEEELAAYCKKERISIIAYSPLAHGLLLNKKYTDLVNFLSEVGRRYGKTPVQVALNWLMSKENVIPIPKASSKEHVNEIVGACGWALHKHDVESINTFLYKYRRRSVASIAKPVMNSHPLVLRLIMWLGGGKSNK